MPKGFGMKRPWFSRGSKRSTDGSQPSPGSQTSVGSSLGEASGTPPPIPESTAEPMEDEDDMPPPVPLWGNKKNKEPKAEPMDTSGEGAGPAPGGMPPLPPGLKPMWSNKGPKEGSSVETSEKSGKSVTLPPGRLASEAPSEVDFLGGLDEVSEAGGLLTPASGKGGKKGYTLERRMTHNPDGEETQKKYIKQYELGKTLGKGSYAKVKLCTDSDTGERWAMKIFNKSLLKRRRMWDSRVSQFKTAFDDVLHEIAIMRKLDHENVMTMKAIA